jgi:hypothetical protein
MLPKVRRQRKRKANTPNVAPPVPSAIPQTVNSTNIYYPHQSTSIPENNQGHSPFDSAQTNRDAMLASLYHNNNSLADYVAMHDAYTQRSIPEPIPISNDGNDAIDPIHDNPIYNAPSLSESPLYNAPSVSESGIPSLHESLNSYHSSILEPYDPHHGEHLHVPLVPHIEDDHEEIHEVPEIEPKSESDNEDEKEIPELEGEGREEEPKAPEFGDFIGDFPKERFKYFLRTDSLPANIKKANENKPGYAAELHRLAAHLGVSYEEEENTHKLLKRLRTFARKHELLKKIDG